MPLKMLAEEKQFMKTASALLKDKADIDYFKKLKQNYATAEKIAETDEQKELLLNKFVQARHQIVFLLFRKGLLPDEIKDTFLEMETIEDANKRYAEKEKERLDRQDAESKRLHALKEEEDKMDIFKAVLNGMDEEKAKAELQKYQEEASKAIQAQG